MSSNGGRSEERVLQLLADHATEGLELNATGELGRLSSLGPQYDESYFEQAAAAVDLAMMPPTLEPLPAGLRDRILLEARRFFGTGEE